MKLHIIGDMDLITRKSDVRIRLQECLNTYDKEGLIDCCDATYKTLLSHKVKFPLLEFCGEQHVKILFDLLLTCANTTNKEIRQGIGWAAKTTAKFHPDIIRFRESELNNTENVASWFRKKVAIGLERHQHAKGN